MSVTQLSLDLIHREAYGAVIDQRSADGYINATALCKAAGKLWSDYRRNSTTIEFLQALEADMGISISTLIHSAKGGDPKLQGTWVHPQVAIHLAQWLSATFAVKVSKWVHEWISGKQIHVTPAALPAHLRRYLNNDGRVPTGYFSVLQETSLNLFGPLHNVGFEIPADWVPDISVGKLFCKWLRDEIGIDTDALPTYTHSYGDARGDVQAKLYPDELLANFRRWFKTKWLPENGMKYFKKKDPNSVAYLGKIPALAAPAVPQKLPC